MAASISHHSAELSKRASMLVRQLTEDHDPRQSNRAHTMSFSNGQSSGGEPAKPPVKANDIAITISALLENGFTHKDLGTEALECVATYLEAQLGLGNGVIDLEADGKPDTDTTAEAISALCLLGRSPSPEGLAMHCDSCEYFKTYDNNRPSNFNTNCHVLKAFLGLLPSNSQHTYRIKKAVISVCEYWWTTNEPVSYQSHKSKPYSTMLMVDSFTRLVRLWQNGHMTLLDDPSICGKIIISLFQALIRILQTQDIDGSWESGDTEVVSYALISLTKLTFLSFSPKIRCHIFRAIESGQRFLRSSAQAPRESNSLRRRDPTPGSPVMHQAYRLAALKATAHKQQTEIPIESYIQIPLAKITIQTNYFARQVWFANVPDWLIQACLIETHLFLPQIREARYAILPRNCVIDDRYYESVPFAFTVANALEDRNIRAEIIHQMSLLTIINRQLESYLERVMGDTLSGCALEVERIVYDKFEGFAYDNEDHCLSDSRDASYPRSSKVRALSDVHSILHRFISHLLDHPYVVRASPHDKAQLRSELLSFLIGRIRQLSGGQDDSCSTDQTPHLYTFAFLACLAGKPNSSSDSGPNGDFLDSPEQQYLAADLCRHMSIISFISNSNTADKHQAVLVEPTLIANQSSVDTQHALRSPSTLSLASTSSSSYEDSESPVSPISSVSSISASSPIESVFSRSASLDTPSQETLQIARLLSHERRCLNMCFEGLLEAGITEETANIIKFFVDFNDLAEQIYRDPNIGSSCQPAATNDGAEEACIIPPPVPPKRSRGSVATARAALNVETNASQQPHQQRPSTPKRVKADRRNFSVAPSIPISKDCDWSWNNPPATTSRRPCQPSSEVNRIESIMSEIDGVKLQFESKPKPAVQPKPRRRTASESHANHAPLQPHINNTHRRLTSLPIPTQDAESIKLAKARLETQRRIRQETERRNTKAETIMLGRWSDRPQKQEWIKVPPAERLESMEVRAKKLSRASRLGGPRWKAPF